MPQIVIYRQGLADVLGAWRRRCVDETFAGLIGFVLPDCILRLRSQKCHAAASHVGCGFVRVSGDGGNGDNGDNGLAASAVMAER
jgi:hypothetical protein